MWQKHTTKYTKDEKTGSWVYQHNLLHPAKPQNSMTFQVLYHRASDGYEKELGVHHLDLMPESYMLEDYIRTAELVSFRDIYMENYGYTYSMVNIAGRTAFEPHTQNGVYIDGASELLNLRELLRMACGTYPDPKSDEEGEIYVSFGSLGELVPLREIEIRFYDWTGLSSEQCPEGKDYFVIVPNQKILTIDRATPRTMRWSYRFNFKCKRMLNADELAKYKDEIMKWFADVNKIKSNLDELKEIGAWNWFEDIRLQRSLYYYKALWYAEVVKQQAQRAAEEVYADLNITKNLMTELADTVADIADLAGLSPTQYYQHYPKL